MSDQLSRLATKLAQLVKSSSHAYDELGAYGAPSECYHSLAHGVHSTASRIAKEHGYRDLEAALSALEDRTSYRWVYFSGMGMLHQ